MPWFCRCASRVTVVGVGLVFGLAQPLAGSMAAPAGKPVTRGPAYEAMRVLKAECFSCHNEKKKKGGLVLTSRPALLDGSDSGPVAEPGHPDASPMARVILADSDPHMPPKKQLSAAQIQLIRNWIQGGMTWDAAALAADESILAAELSPLPESYRPVLALALAPEAKRLAVARGGMIVIHDTSGADFPVVRRIEAHRDAVQSLGWSPDGRWLVSGGFRRLVWWNASSFKLERELTDGLIGRVTALQFSPDSRTLALADGVAGQSGYVRVIRLPEGQLVDSWLAHEDTIFGLDFSRDGAQLVTAGGDKLIKVWELAPRKELARLEGHGAQVLSVAFNPDATQVVSGGADKELNVWDVKTREKIISLGAPATAVSAVSWPGEGKTIIAATGGSGVFSYTNLKPHTGEQKSKGGDEKKIGEATDTVYCVATTADAATIFAGGQDGMVHAWSREGKLLAKLAPGGAADRIAGEAPSAGPPRPGAGSRQEAGKDPIGLRVPAGSAARAPGNSNAPPVSFIRDVLPALSRAGCNAGACHAKAEGQNGFKLSVFSYDPKSDYDAIVKGARARRVFPAAPDESLIVQKATATLEHEGGRRFEKGSETHELLVRWLREGMAYQVPNEPALQRIAVVPQERNYPKHAVQPLRVEAYYADGSRRDVTRLAAFVSHDAEIAAVSEEGVVTVGNLSGQGVVVARYMGLVGDAQITVPADRLLPAEKYASLPRNNFIDQLAYAQFQRLGLFPSELCSDAEFLRRAQLDAVGRLPTPAEVRAFLADGSPDKRRAAIRRILEDTAYADYWANKWADLVRPNPDRVGIKSVFTLDQWLRRSFRQNKPYDQFVREILVAEGTNHRDGPAVIYRDRREPADLATMFSQLFLGTRLECARCHNHPNEKWSQDDFYHFAAFFGPVKQKGAGLSPPISAGTETFYFGPGGKVKHPVTGEVMAPRSLDGAPLPAAKDGDPRQALADSLTTPGNPLFAPAAVNRVWANFFGRGLVEPVDDFRISNPGVNSPLLSALARDFAEHGYDLKHLLRTIMESRLYQLSATPNEFNLADTRNFSRAYRRRLPAEVLLDAVSDATGVPDTFAGMPLGSRATQAWSYKIESQFMDAFSRPDPSADPPCERDTRISVVQSLHLMNSTGLQSKLGHASGRVRQLAGSEKSPAEIVTELYLTTLSRPPAKEELAVATAAFGAQDATRQSAAEDVFWALLNSPEFVFNH